MDEWEKLNPDTEILNWLRNGVDVHNYFCHFKGNFAGKPFDSDIPPSMYFPNAKKCQDHATFIKETLSDRVRNGSLLVWGKVGSCLPPHLVMPLTVEPTKPRLCHDERFLNLWIVDKPFNLDTLKDVPRLIPEGSYMSSVDDKSGYDHVRLSENSRTYFGVQFGGWYLVFATIPFGFKTSAYIYNSIGLVATSYCRKLGVPCLQYIDDRLIGEVLQQQRLCKGIEQDGIKRSLMALYIVCDVLTRLGYFIGLKKSVFKPSQLLRFLGLLVDSLRQAFVVPEDKRASFAELRDFILDQESVDLKTLQRFSGKCISFLLAIPSAKLFTREINIAIGQMCKNSRRACLSGSLKTEIAHWKFLDAWDGCVSWREEKHLQISLATDSSLYKWGGFLNSDQRIGDYFPEKDTRPIHEKECDALLNTLVSFKSQLMNHRVDAFVDNKSVVSAWENQHCKTPVLISWTKQVFEFVSSNNIDLHLHYIQSSLNPADLDSRVLSRQDCKLSSTVWRLLQDSFGPHTCDLMSLDSNVMVNEDGAPLKHFTPYPTPDSAGVNVFAQCLKGLDGLYVFPPFCLISPLLQFLFEQRPKSCTFVFPEFKPLPVWWPKMWAFAQEHIVLGDIGDRHVLLEPSKAGFRPKPLAYKLFAVKLVF